MKKVCLSFLILLYSMLSVNCFSQNGWTRKADYAAGYGYGAVSIPIANVGFVTTGLFIANYTSESWVFDPSTNVWTQKANFPGHTRINATGFSIGSKGYLGTGFYVLNSVYYYLNDFWEFDLATNTWTQKADFGGAKRAFAVGFSINNKGYIGTGFYRDTIILYNSLKDFWEYNPVNDTWNQRADFAGGLRDNAVGFSIGTKGYICSGEDDMGYFHNDLWQYSPSTNAWYPRASFSGSARYRAAGGSVGTKGFIGTGSQLYPNTYKKDFFEYNSVSNTWSNIASLPANSRDASFGLGIGNKFYIGCGIDSSCLNYTDFWEYDPSATGILETENSLSCSIFPNPTISSCTISVSGMPTRSLNGNFELYDVNGKLARTILIDKDRFILERGNLPSGVYFYRLNTDDHFSSSGKILFID